MSRRRFALVVSIAIAALMVVSSMGLISGLTAARGAPAVSAAAPQTGSAAVGESTHAAASPSVGSTHQPVAPGAAAEAKLQAAIHASHVDLEKIYPPNLMYAPTMRNGIIAAPSYPEAPEPAGLADYGVINSSGTPQPITIDTTSYRASLSLNSVLPYYLTTGVPEGFTSQLNVVLQNVTLFGNSSYNFWTQNVLFYDAYSQQLFIENNIWNFSAPVAPQPTSTFLTNISGYTNGSDDPSIGYYAAGTPTFNGITTPFTVMFYINATTYDSTWGTQYTEVDFTFNLSYAGGAHFINWTYDRALFNNTGYTGAIPQAHFHIDGTNLTPTGFIPYDAEIMLGGPGGGSTATFYGLNGTMTLQHWNATSNSYVNEPSAWSSGSETGETAVGVSDYYSADDVAHVGAGPEFIQPFWNSSATATAGAAVLSGLISPSNAWAFVTNGAVYNISNSAWGPLPVVGNYTWDLTQGTYTVKLMESDYNVSFSTALTLTSGDTTPFSVTLSANASMGVYAPLYALANSQLAAISTGGTGTVSDPYLLAEPSSASQNLSGEFAATNDYEFPAYSGISLWGTSAYVEIQPVPMLVDFWGTSLGTANYFGTATSDDLAIWLFETSHVSIVGGDIAGWTGPEQTGFPYANLVLWNATSTLVLGTEFDVTDTGVFTYGGTGNVFVQNLFLNSPLPYATMEPVGYILPYGELGIPGSIALIENEGGDTIWNNEFSTTFTALETNFNVYDDLYASVPEAFANNWNLSAPVPQFTPMNLINGFTWGDGAYGGYPYVCGNWWYDFLPDNTSLPYDENVGIALIATGGDYCPAGSLGTLVFGESGLPAGTSWSVGVHGGTLSGSTPVLTTVVPKGTYSFTVGSVTGFSPSPASGSVNAVPQGGVTTRSIAFSSTASTSGTLLGSVSPASATVKVDGTAVTLTAGAFNVTVSVGTHAIVATASNYYPYYNNATVSSGGTTTVTVTLNPMPTTPPPAANGNISLAVTTAGATAWVDGTAVTLTSGAYFASVTAGVHSVEVQASGYFSYYNNVSVTSGKTTSVSVALNPVTTTTVTNSTSNSGISSTAWAIIGLLAALVIVLLIVLLLVRGGRKPTPTEPSPSAPTSSTGPDYSPTEGGKSPPPSS